MAKSLVLVILLSACLAAVSGHDWSEFKAKHNKRYANQLEETMRRAIFEKNVERIEQLNKRDSTYKLNINHLADRSDEELASMYDRSNSVSNKDVEFDSSRGKKFLRQLLERVKLEDLPAEVDWTEVEGRVSPVRDEGTCNGDWAFSAAGLLEGQLKPRNVSFVPLSVQNLIDCSIVEGGCSGGDPLKALSGIKSEGGIESDESYPYLGATLACAFDRSKSILSIDGGVQLASGDEEALMKVVANFGPVSVQVDGSHWPFKFYSGGVYYEPNCGSSLTRYLLVVGYGTDVASGLDYWLVKNSWGTDWGLSGYIKMARNRNNSCGIASKATVALF